MDDADPQRAAGRIQAARHYRCALAQPGQRSRLPGKPPCDFAAFAQPGQQLRPDACLPAQRSIPFPPFHVEAVPPIALGQVLRHAAGEPVDNVAVGLEHLFRTRIHVRKMVFQPQHLGHGMSGRYGIAGAAKPCFFADGPHHLRAFSAGSGICPYGRRIQDSPVFIDGNHRPALPVYADSGDIGCTDAAFLKHSANAAYSRFPPIVRILLRPARLGIADAIRTFPHGDGAAPGVKQRRFARRSANIDSQEIAAHVTPFLRLRTRR